MNTDKDTVHRSGYLKVVDKPVPQEEENRVKYTKDGETQWHFDMAKELHAIVDDIFKWNDKMFKKGGLNYGSTINRIESEFASHRCAQSIEDQLDAIGEISFFLVSGGWNIDYDHYAMRCVLEAVTDGGDKPFVFDSRTKYGGMLPYLDLYQALIELAKAHKLTDKAYRDILRATVKGSDVMKDVHTGNLSAIAKEHGLTKIGSFNDYSKPKNRLGFAPLVSVGVETSGNYYANLCLEEAGKSTLKDKVGCVLVDKQGFVIAKGANYDPDGIDCEAPGHIISAVNDALIEVPYDRYVLEGGAVYTTSYPSEKDVKELKSHGTSYIVMVAGDPISPETIKEAKYNLDENRTDSFGGTGPDGAPVELESDQFRKFDADKPMYNLIPPSSLKRLAVILTHGAEKYGANNWQKCTDLDRYVSALYRHLEAVRLGEKIDPDSGEPHTAHMLANAVFIDHLTNEGE